MKFIYYAVFLVLSIVSQNPLLAQEANDANNTQNNIYTTMVKGNCGMCSERILKIANTVSGVESSKYVLNENKLILTINEEFDETLLHYLISGAGHTTSSMVADHDAYHKLPACCQYATEDHVHNEDVVEDEPSTVQNEQDIPIEGVILSTNDKGEEIPVEGANIRWLNSDFGITTDEKGYFSLDKLPSNSLLEISHVAYQDEVIDMSTQSKVKVVLVSNLILDEIGITAKKRTASVSYLETMQSLNISKEELLKAACCSLAESFITTSSIDNTVSDAVTGTKKIEMLGLAGPYILLTKENMEDIRGLSSLTGFDLVPGSWVSSIQINPGSASVVNGYEGITGQINVELFKPDGPKKFMMDLYGNTENRYEASMHMSQKLADNVHTSVSFLGAQQNEHHDKNKDSFYDMPLHKKWMIFNRYKWVSPTTGWRGQFGAKYAEHNDIAGQVDPHAHHGHGSHGHEHPNEPAEDRWISQSTLNRIELFNKAGTILKNKPTASIGTKLKYVRHHANNNFGERRYDGLQESLYSNIQYQDQINSKKHKYRVGASFILDNYIENVDLTNAVNKNFNRLEWVPGAFLEYTYSPNEKLNVVAGLRGDYHNLYKFMFTPRLNIRYAPTEETVFRVSAGKGTKTANIFTEQIGMFASNRRIIIDSQNNSLPYGLNPEIAWNFGLHYNQMIDLLDREHVLNLSVFRTQFQNQVIVDMDKNPQEIHFYNLNGNSYSNSVQVQYETEIIERFSVRLAYRYNDVKSTYRSLGLANRPLISPHRAFVNLAYATPSKWKFDFTLNWISDTRLPNSSLNPDSYRWAERSEDYYLAFAHISKQWKNWEFFVGGENLFNYRQKNPIVSADDPNSKYFDASMIWGPIFGRKIYYGIRYNLNKKEK